MGNYGRFASIYDELMTDLNYEDWFIYIEDIFKKYNKRPKTVLEMACGTGNLSYYLGKNGYDLTCFDRSVDMLSRADEKLSEIKNVKILNQNMIDFNIYKTFDAVVCICDSINYITKKEDLLQIFKNVWNHLDEDGIFIFDINSFYKLKYIIGNNTFIEDREDIFYIWENYFDEKESICEFYLTFFLRDHEERYERFNEDHIEKAYKIEEIMNLLKEAGFKKIDYFEAFSFQSPKEDSERINFVVRK